MSDSGWIARAGDASSSRLGGWSDGYTTDAVYADHVTGDLCPAWFSMISVLNGQPPLDLSRKLVWLDIACGTGLAACTVAAGHPDIEVWGVDYNPSHIERARRIAALAGLTNTTFVEADFATLAQDRTVGPSDVDVVVVNGVYSWVSATNQRRIVDAIAGRLRPGGLAHVMYEIAAGWASMIPVAEALRLTADADGRPGGLAFHDAAATIARLASSGAEYFPMGNRETHQMQGWADLDGSLGAHEYLGANFGPLDVSNVHDLMATAKCSFLGGLNALDHHRYYSVPREFADVLGARGDVMREMIRDLTIQVPLRNDLFRRGRAKVTRVENEDRLRHLEIVGLGLPFSEVTVNLPAMQVALDPSFHVPLVEALQSRRLDVPAVLDIHPTWTLADATAGMALLVAAGYAAPSNPGAPTSGAVDGCRRLNRVLGHERRLGYGHGCVVTPVTGAMVTLDLVEALALDAIWDGAPPDSTTLSSYASNVFAELGLTVRDENHLVEDRNRASEIVGERVRRLLERLPALDVLGVV